MKQFITLLAIFILGNLSAQYDGNTSPDYSSLVMAYEQLAIEHEEIEFYDMGPSDYGEPIYLCVINGAGKRVLTFEKARNSTTILINNAIHPGEPDGVNACLIWINDWIKRGKKLKGLPVIAIIPAYNVGGMRNRSGTSRANQNGPEEYGFRGNAQNLDLNRDFIKMDSKNMFTFAKIYHSLNPDVFIDTHVSNGADYQYTMTYIASVRERMPKALADLMHDQLIPHLKKHSSKRGFDLIPYVHLKGDTPETGIMVFNDLPRYAMGYASLLNSISFTTETHMLKPFPDRVQSTLVFIDETIKWMMENKVAIEDARDKAINEDLGAKWYKYNYDLTDKKDSIMFKGFEFSKPTSEITGKERLKYHEDKPYEKYVPYYHNYRAKDSVEIPKYFIIGGQCESVISRLKANNISMERVELKTERTLKRIHIDHFENGNKPYEGHFLHNKIKMNTSEKSINLKEGDMIVPMNQPNSRFIMSVLIPESPDSYFAWNMFDSYVQQKEYFSPYVFEDKAKEILETDMEFKNQFEERKKADNDFRESTWDQLYFIYKYSDFYEPSHNVLPVFRSIELR